MDDTDASPRPDHLAVNRANWDSRADVHAEGSSWRGLVADPSRLSTVVAFDLPRLGRLDGLDVLHLQCHIGTDTVSLARLGARTTTGVDLSPRSVEVAREIAALAGADVTYVAADVESAVEALGGRTFDLVYTGVGALCWLPDMAAWGRACASLLRPGGRLFVRDGHPVLNAALGVTVRDEEPDRTQAPFVSGPGERTPALELPYWQQDQPLVWVDESTYAGDGVVTSPTSMSWNHGLGEIVMAALDAGLALTLLEAHDSVPWEALPGMMTERDGEWRLTHRPERCPASFTMIATMGA